MVNTVIFLEDTTHIGFIKFEEIAEKKCFQQPILNFLIQQSALFISKSMTEEKIYFDHCKKKHLSKKDKY
jgi:hypothetical protein